VFEKYTSLHFMRQVRWQALIEKKNKQHNNAPVSFLIHFCLEKKKHAERVAGGARLGCSFVRKRRMVIQVNGHRGRGRLVLHSVPGNFSEKSRFFFHFFFQASIKKQPFQAQKLKKKSKID